MDDLVAAGTDAIMISSVDPKTSIDAFNRIAAQVPLFTTDSDAPSSDRIAYLGSSNTDAGIQAGEIAKKAMPNGGKCMGFVGFLGADNAVERISGFRKAVEGSGIELVDVRGDDVDFARARSNVDEPTRGIDVGAKAEVYHVLQALADQGVGILMISSDMEEVIGVSNRVAVMCEGEIAGILPSDELTEHRILSLAVA